MKRQIFNRYLTPREESKLFRHLRLLSANILARRDLNWMIVLRQTGIRIGTLAALTVDDARDVLHDRRHHLALPPEICKGGRGYTVSFNSPAVVALRELIKIRKEQGFAEWPGCPLVMSQQRMKGLSVRSFQHRMQTWVRGAGLSVQATPHWFRHTLAKRVLATTTHQSPLQVVQFALGHQSSRSTEIYTVPDRVDIDDAMELAK